MTSIINNQPVYIQQLATPQVTDTLTTPSLPPNVGCIAFDATDPASIYVGNGTSWNKITSSGSTGGVISQALLKDCTLIASNVYGNASPTAFGHTFSSLASTNTRNIFLPDGNGTALLDTLSQSMSSKFINNSFVIANTQIGNINGVSQGHTFTSSATVAGRNVTIPDTSGQMILDSATQNMANKTIINLTSSGSTDSMLSGKVTRSWFQGTSNGTTPVIVFTGSTTPTFPLTYRIVFQGFVGSGTHANGSLQRSNVSLVVNVGGTASVIGTTSVSSINTTGLNGATIVPVASGSSINVTFTGVAGDAITFTGFVEIDS